MTRFAQEERNALCDTFLDVGPHAPTLCVGWDTADLATHLVVRDGRPDLIIGSKLPVLGSAATARMKAIKSQPWPQLVAKVKAGPPAYTPTAIGAVDEFVNTVEFFVHHEDVLRGTPGFVRRQISDEESAALWAALHRGGKLMFRRSAVGVELVSPLGRLVVKAPTERGSVVVAGEPGELLLAAYGRHRATELDMQGDPGALEALWQSPLGIG